MKPQEQTEDIQKTENRRRPKENKTNVELFSSKSNSDDQLSSEISSHIDSPPPTPQKKNSSKKKSAINTLLADSPASNSDFHNEIQNSIRKKSDLEKWSKYFEGKFSLDYSLFKNNIFSLL